MRAVLEGAKVALAVVVACSIPGPTHELTQRGVAVVADWVSPDEDTPQLSEHLEFAPGWVPPSQQ